MTATRDSKRSKGRLALPQKLCKELGLALGSHLALSQLSDGAVLVRLKHRSLSSLAGILTRPGQPKVSIEEMSR